jgi:hypothetical protein
MSVVRITESRLRQIIRQEMRVAQSVRSRRLQEGELDNIKAGKSPDFMMMLREYPVVEEMLEQAFEVAEEVAINHLENNLMSLDLDLTEDQISFAASELVSSAIDTGAGIRLNLGK